MSLMRKRNSNFETSRNTESKKKGRSSGSKNYIDLYLPLLGKITTLRQSDHVEQIDQIRVELQQMYQDIMNRVASQRDSSDRNREKNISYLLCCYIDEAILSNSWGVASRWINDSFLSQHHPVLGGEHFYQRLKECLDEPRQHSEELQLFFLILSTGYLGKMRMLKDAPKHIADLRHRIYQNGIEPYIDSSFHFSVFQDLEMEKETRFLSRLQRFAFPLAILAVVIAYFSLNYALLPYVEELLQQMSLGGLS